MSINLRAACVNAAKQVLKEYDVSAVIALNKGNAGDQDFEKIREIRAKYAPNWQELLSLDRKDPIDEIMASYLDYYFFRLLIALACMVRDLSDFLPSDHLGDINKMV